MMRAHLEGLVRSGASCCISVRGVPPRGRRLAEPDEKYGTNLSPQLIRAEIKFFGNGKRPGGGAITVP